MTKPKKFLERLFKPFVDGRKKEGREEKELEAIAAKEQKAFRYEALAAATRNFDPKQKLGEGGFGSVFKGRLEDGREVAVKRLGWGSRQGAREFMNEALLLSRVQHKNLVNLHGYCAHANEKLLVYEYVPNESLDKLLFLEEEGNWKRMQLDWRRRFQVIAGVARGLLYLHEDAHTTIIHRDIKASNILLDGGWVPKIADFGLARLFPEDQSNVKTRVVGTNGYMAPEYVMRGSLSTKVDVFSFGVVVLELISGLKNSAFARISDPEASSLLEWAWKLYNEGRSLELLDPALKSTVDAEQVALCVQLGLLCVQSDPKQRPDMKRVVIVLSKKPRTLEEPTRPGTPAFSYPRFDGTRGSVYSSGESSSTVNSASTAATTTTAATTSTTITVNRSSHREQRSARR
ncbi:cysteine-rich receptor-like protein kinase 43 [Musa acuminata AAA Group]|uniref:cysteine-rich receptor-like protein kinase 43 n=1 Tax=Musa acuminata AAA Group TaxID=214697 RepID=UPI0031DC9C12